MKGRINIGAGIGDHFDFADLKRRAFGIMGRGFFAAQMIADYRPRQTGIGYHAVFDDVVFGDDDGVVFALLQDVDDIISLARTIAKTETQQAENIKNGKTLSQQFKFDEYLKKRSKDKSYTFRKHLQKIGGAIEV